MPDTLHMTNGQMQDLVVDVLRKNGCQPTTQLQVIRGLVGKMKSKEVCLVLYSLAERKLIKQFQMGRGTAYSLYGVF